MVEVIKSVDVDIAQDADEENAKAKKKPKISKDGFDNPKLYLFPGTQAADQVLTLSISSILLTSNSIS
jgi:hypothetical protein